MLHYFTRVYLKFSQNSTALYTALEEKFFLASEIYWGRTHWAGFQSTKSHKER